MAFSITMPGGISFSGSPQTYYGTQTADEVQANASRAQQWAIAQQQLDANNWAAKLGLQGKLAELETQERMPGINFQYQNQLQAAQLANALQQAELQANTQKYGYDNQLQSALAQVMGQQNVAALNADTNRYATDVNARNSMQVAGLQNEGANYRAGLEAQTASLTPLLKQERFNTVLPIFQGLLSGIGGQMGVPMGAMGSPSPQMFNPPAATAQPSGAAKPSGFDGNDFWHQQYANAVAEGRLPQGSPLPYSPNSGQVETYLQQYLGGNKNAKYTAPDPQPGGQQQVQQIPASQFQNAQGGGGGGGGNTNSSSSSGGSSSSTTNFGSGGPQINLSPPTSPQQWDQQINDQVARNNQGMATQNNQLARSYGARYGSFGRQGVAGINRNNARLAGLNQQARTQIPLQGQKAYSDYMLGGQTAQANQWNNQQQLGLQNRQIQTSLFSPLISALTGLAG